MIRTPDPGPVHCRLVFEYPSEAAARVVAGALAVDDPDVVTIRSDGTVFMCTIHAPGIPSLLQTLNDLLPCLRVAEEMARTGEERTENGQRGRSVIATAIPKPCYR